MPEWIQTAVQRRPVEVCLSLAAALCFTLYMLKSAEEPVWAGILDG